MATMLDFVVFSTLVHIPEFSTSRAAAFGAMSGGILHFTLCKIWVFDRSHQNIADAALSYFIISGSALFLHSFCTTMLSNLMPDEMAWLLSKGVVFTCWMYPASRYIVFGNFSFVPRPLFFVPTPKDKGQRTKDK
ncbi:GtrA family protein [[Phormidium] sp. ETS-05]|uniref:GtrA family protein n=1 Tax=[Phormidium] sp. ETS-05 TaxID=222819 RepID=UPI0018EF2248|nr:GtrA family protein [[Phormidium] sp. ETS-05]